MRILVSMIFCSRLAFACCFILFCCDATYGQRRGNVREKEELLHELVRLNDDHISSELNHQWTEKGVPFEGAIFDGDSVVSPIRTAGFVQTLMCGYVSRESRYYRSREILDRMTLAARALVNLQHEDGTIDLLSTNFHSTPDLGFTIFPLAISYSIMLAHKELPFGSFSAPLKNYLLKAGDALSVGGIHTPNHRWVVSAALAWLHSFFGDPRYKTRIDQWLAEKIDIDPDGQYQERSTAVYTPVTNRCLIDIAEKMKYHHLYDAVRKNLDMTLYFVHANGEIVTESSRRQDKYVRSDLSRYYLAYNYLALLDKNARYAGMVNYIRETVSVGNLLYMLPQFIANPSLLEDLPAPVPPPTMYHRHFRHSDMVRVREDRVDMSIITDNPVFLTYFKGDAALEGVRLASAFFGKGQFVGQQMEKQRDTYVLTFRETGPYYQPLPKDKIPADTHAWTKSSIREREQSEVQTLVTKVFITPHEGKVAVKVEVDGPENLPVTLELGFRSGGTLENVSKKHGVDHAFLARQDSFATYRYGSDTIRVGPGTLTHKWTQLRGALPKMDADCLYFTAYAPCTFEFTIE